MKIAITKRKGKNLDVPVLIVNEELIELGHFVVGEKSLGELSGQRISTADFRQTYPLAEIREPQAPGSETVELHDSVSHAFVLSKNENHSVLLTERNALVLVLTELLSTLADNDEVKFD
jgi:hypothetical protein